MTIPEIKAALPIAAVLAHYGLEAGPTGAMRCPFHVDESASVKVYHDTNTAYCFAGSCAVQSVDVIDFIMAKEKGSKRAAILKAKELCGGSLTTVPVNKPKQTVPELDLAAIYEESFAGMQRTP